MVGDGRGVAGQWREYGNEAVKWRMRNVWQGVTIGGKVVERRRWLKHHRSFDRARTAWMLSVRACSQLKIAVRCWRDGNPHPWRGDRVRSRLHEVRRAAVQGGSGKCRVVGRGVS